MASEATPNRRRNSTAAKPATSRKRTSGTKTTTRKRAPAAAPAPAAPVRQSRGDRAGAVGTVEKHSKQVAEFLKAVKAAARGRKVWLHPSVQPELLVKIDSGTTVCYLYQREGATDLTARYPAFNLNVKGVGGSVTYAQAAKEVLANLAKRPARTARTAPQPTVAEVTQKRATNAAKKSGGGKSGNSRSGNSTRARSTRSRSGSRR